MTIHVRTNNARQRQTPEARAKIEASGFETREHFGVLYAVCPVCKKNEFKDVRGAMRCCAYDSYLTRQCASKRRRKEGTA